MNTSKKGWADDKANWAIFEVPSVTDRVSSKVMREATVIIDVMGSAVVKNRFDQVSSDEVVTHYMTKYKPQVAEAMDIWLSRMSKRIAADPTMNPSDLIASLRKTAPDAAEVIDDKIAEVAAAVNAA
ncbi:MAG: hypothetical protein EOP89_07825 [Lysobacteraceae bacterium]|nr:MAG: hypothetical protein EOP89_07825 [Xanthomonadaceae bacterium]